MNNNSNKTKEIFDNIVNRLQSIIDKGDYEKFLKFQKSFKGYSFNNLVLIFSQFPDATRVAGKSKWLRKYDKKTKKIVDGEEIEDTETIQYNAYRWVYVFDVSQTEGKDLPLQTHYINAEDMVDFYENLKNFSHLPVLEQELIGGTQGYYSKNEQKIVIKQNMSANDKASVLLHELAHSLYDDFDYKTDRNLSEVFVESIAYIVADHFGLDTSLCSFNYIIKWAKGEPKVVVDLGNKIQKCANEFIDKIEKFEMQELDVAA